VLLALHKIQEETVVFTEGYMLLLCFEIGELRLWNSSFTSGWKNIWKNFNTDHTGVFWTWRY